MSFQVNGFTYHILKYDSQLVSLLASWLMIMGRLFNKILDVKHILRSIFTEDEKEDIMSYNDIV